MHLYGATYSLTLGARWAILSVVIIFFVLICATFHKLFKRMTAEHAQLARQEYTLKQYRYIMDCVDRFYVSYGLPSGNEARQKWLRESIANTPFRGWIPKPAPEVERRYEHASQMEDGEGGLQISWPIGRPSKRVKHKRSLAQDFGNWKDEREQYDKGQQDSPFSQAPPSTQAQPSNQAQSSGQTQPSAQAQPSSTRRPSFRNRLSRRSVAFKTSTRLRTVQEEADEQPQAPAITPSSSEAESTLPLIPELIDLPTVYHSMEAKKRRRYARVAPSSPEDLVEATPRMPSRTPTMIDSYPAPVPLTRTPRTTRTSRTSSSRPLILTPTRAQPLIEVDTPPPVPPPKDDPGYVGEVPNRSTSLKTIAAGEDAFRARLKGALMPPAPVAYAPNGLRAKMQEDAEEWRRSGK